MSEIKSINIILDKKKGANIPTSFNKTPLPPSLNKQPLPPSHSKTKKKYEEDFDEDEDQDQDNQDSTDEDIVYPTNNNSSCDKEKTQTKDYIRKNLMNYKECNIDEIPLGTYLKFITIRKNKESFNIGGILKKVYPEYCVFVKGNFLFRVTKNFYDPGGELIYKSRFFMSEQQPNNVLNAEKIEKLDKDGNYIVDENNLQDAIKRMEERKIQKKEKV